MADIVDIVVQKTEEVVTIDVTTNETIVNIISQNGGGGAVDSVNGQTGVVVLDADDISDSTTTNKYVTSAEKTAITHSNRTILDQITEAFTTALKTAYDSSVTWITTNGTNLINHLSNTSNPHSTTATQVDALKRDGSNANSNINIGEYDLKAGQFTLDTSPTGTAAVGTTRWNDTLGSTETTLKGGSVILKNGVDLVARVVNKVTPNTTLTKAAYQAVRVSGAQGQRLAVAYAQANNDNNSADTIGIVCETIATNQEGFILTVGQLEGVNTTGSLQGETWADGDVIYLSPTTAGALTNVKPTGATGHIVIIGYVEYSHAVNGKLYVKIMNGWELDELHNVNISSPTNNQILAYTSSTQLWENKSVGTALGFTPENVANKSTNLTSPDNTKYPTTLAVSNALDPLIKRRYFDDLQGYGTGGVGSIFAGTGTLETEGNIWINRNGTGTTWVRTPAEAGHSGIIRGGTGTTSSGLNLIQFRSIWLGTEDFICQTAVRIQNLSDATNRFTIGFSNGVGTVNSMRIFYSDNINGGKWQCETYSGSLSTLVDSGILVAANTWYDLKMTRINMICYFYINNVLVATSSTNIPSNIESFCGTTISKIVGTTSRTCDFDYLKFFDL